MISNFEKIFLRAPRTVFDKCLCKTKLYTWTARIPNLIEIGYAQKKLCSFPALKSERKNSTINGFRVSTRLRTVSCERFVVVTQWGI